MLNCICIIYNSRVIKEEQTEEETNKQTMKIGNQLMAKKACVILHTHNTGPCLHLIFHSNKVTKNSREISCL